MNIRDQMSHLDESQAPYPPICQLRFFLLPYPIHSLSDLKTVFQPKSIQIYLRVAFVDPRVSRGFRV